MMRHDQPHLGQPLAIVGHAAIRCILDGGDLDVPALIREAYLLHDAGDTVVPRVPFLRFPDRPEARIGALPAYVGGRFKAAGLKWIASFPRNLTQGRARASACILLNDPDTGTPFACLEGATISSARTAASAVLGAAVLNRGRHEAGLLAIVGCGEIARNIAGAYHREGWKFERLVCFDLRPVAAEAMAAFVRSDCPGLATEIAVAGTFEDAAGFADMIVFATTAQLPHVPAACLRGRDAIILHVSLRDLPVELIETSFNIVDDVDHCLSSSTSLHLTEQALGHRTFVAGTLADAMLGRVEVPGSGLRVFSPFGLGVLDLVLAAQIHEVAVLHGDAREIPGFGPATGEE